jgi:hypothetical protein
MVVRSAVAAGLLVIGTLPAEARDCRPADPPPGVRVHTPPGCEARKAQPARGPGQPPAQAGRDPGFVDLGNGSTMRIGGRVRADTVFHR